MRCARRSSLTLTLERPMCRILPSLCSSASALTDSSSGTCGSGAAAANRARSGTRRERLPMQTRVCRKSRGLHATQLTAQFDWPGEKRLHLNDERIGRLLLQTRKGRIDISLSAGCQHPNAEHCARDLAEPSRFQHERGSIPTGQPRRGPIRSAPASSSPMRPTEQAIAKRRGPSA